MLKLFLCIGVLALCVFLAFLLTRKYKQRRDFYYNFSLFNERLLNEVSYARAPLPEFIGKYRFGGTSERCWRKSASAGSAAKIMRFLT